MSEDKRKYDRKTYGYCPRGRGRYEWGDSGRCEVCGRALLEHPRPAKREPRD